MPAVAGPTGSPRCATGVNLLAPLSVTKRPGESLIPAEDKVTFDLAAHAGLVLRNVGSPSSSSRGYTNCRHHVSGS